MHFEVATWFVTASPCARYFCPTGAAERCYDRQHRDCETLNLSSCAAVARLCHRLNCTLLELARAGPPHFGLDDHLRPSPPRYHALARRDGAERGRVHHDR